MNWLVIPSKGARTVNVFRKVMTPSIDVMLKQIKRRSMRNMGKPYDESRVIGLEFYNKTDDQKKLWIEPSCIELVIESKTEYRIEADDMEYRIEFDEEYIILYLQYRFGPKIYKRPYSSSLNNKEEWFLDTDYSSIN